MKLWLVVRTDPALWDEWVDFVCLAETEEEALSIHPDVEFDCPAATALDNTWAAPENRRATCIGEASSTIEQDLKALGETSGYQGGRIVCAYFRHG